MNPNSMFDNPWFNMGMGILSANRYGDNWGRALGEGSLLGMREHRRAKTLASQRELREAQIAELDRKVTQNNALNSMVDGLPVDDATKVAMKNNPELVRKYFTIQQGMDVPSQARQDYDIKVARAGNPGLAPKPDPLDIPIDPSDYGKIVETATGQAPSSLPVHLTRRIMQDRGFGWGSKPDQGERTSAAYTFRMAGSEEALRELEPVDGYDLEFIKDETIGNLPVIGNFLKSERGQRLQTQRRDWVMANIRDESGATVRPDEADDYVSNLFTMPGDSAGTTEQKRQVRQQLMGGMAIKSGKLGTIYYAPPGTQSGAAPSGGGQMSRNNGQRFKTEEEAAAALNLRPVL